MPVSMPVLSSMVSKIRSIMSATSRCHVCNSIYEFKLKMLLTSNENEVSLIKLQNVGL